MAIIRLRQSVWAVRAAFSQGSFDKYKKEQRLGSLILLAGYRYSSEGPQRKPCQANELRAFRRPSRNSSCDGLFVKTLSRSKKSLFFLTFMSKSHTRAAALQI